MKNPFELIDVRLNNIESLLLDLKHNPQKQPETEQNELLNVQQAAKYLNLSVPTIYSKVSKNELPYMKRSKRLYFTKKELSGYIKVGRNKTNDEVLNEVDNYLTSKAN